MEHLSIGAASAVCGQPGNLILFRFGQDVDPELVCRKCKRHPMYTRHQDAVDNPSGKNHFEKREVIHHD